MKTHSNAVIAGLSGALVAITIVAMLGLFCIRRLKRRNQRAGLIRVVSRHLTAHPSPPPTTLGRWSGNRGEWIDRGTTEAHPYCLKYGHSWTNGALEAVQSPVDSTHIEVPEFAHRMDELTERMQYLERQLGTTRFYQTGGVLTPSAPPRYSIDESDWRGRLDLDHGWTGT